MADEVAMMEVCKEYLMDSLVQIVCWHILRGSFGEIRLSEEARLQLCNILRGVCSSLSGPGDLSSEGLKLVKLVTLTQKLEREPSLEILPVLVNVLQSLERFQEFKGVERHTKEAKCQVILECYRVKDMDAGVTFWEKYFGDENEPLAKELSVIVERIGKVSGADISLVVAKLIQSHPYDKFRGDISQELATIFPNLTEPRMYQTMREDIVSIRTHGVYRHTAKNLPQLLLPLKEEPMSEALVGSEDGKGAHNLGEDREMDGGGSKEREGQGDMPPLSDTESVMEEEEMQVEPPEESERDGGGVLDEPPEGDGGVVLEEPPEGVGGGVLDEPPEGDGGVVLEEPPEGVGGGVLDESPEGDGGVVLEEPPEGVGGGVLDEPHEGIGGVVLEDTGGSGIEGEADDDQLPVTTNSLSPVAGTTKSFVPVVRMTRSPVLRMTRSLVPVAETTKSVVDTTTPGPSGVIYSHSDEDDTLFRYENTRRKGRLLQVENTAEGDQIEWGSSSSDESEVHTPPSKIPSGPKIVVKRRESLLGRTRKHGIVKEKKSYPHRRPWDPEEVANLIKGVKQFGTGNWIKIRKQYHFNNRSNVDLKDKWRNLSKHTTA